MVLTASEFIKMHYVKVDGEFKDRNELKNNNSKVKKKKRKNRNQNDKKLIFNDAIEGKKEEMDLNESVQSIDNEKIKINHFIKRLVQHGTAGRIISIVSNTFSPYHYESIFKDLGTIKYISNYKRFKGSKKETISARHSFNDDEFPNFINRKSNYETDEGDIFKFEFINFSITYDPMLLCLSVTAKFRTDKWLDCQPDPNGKHFQEWTQY